MFAEPIRPIETPARVERRIVFLEMRLDAVSVEFDLVEPLVALGYFRPKGSQLRRNEIRTSGLASTLQSSALQRRHLYA